MENFSRSVDKPLLPVLHETVPVVAAFSAATPPSPSVPLHVTASHDAAALFPSAANIFYPIINWNLAKYYVTNMYWSLVGWWKAIFIQIGSNITKELRPTALITNKLRNKSTQSTQTLPTPLQCRPLVSNNISYNVAIYQCSGMWKTDPRSTSGPVSTPKFNHFYTVTTCRCLPSVVDIH